MFPGPVSTSPTTGNLTVQLAAPPSGPFYGIPLFTYNSRAADQTNQFGHGMADVFNTTVTTIESSTAQVIQGGGQSFHFRCSSPEPATCV
jgi:hypothetical protein